MAPRDQNGGGSAGGAADPEADIEAPLISPGSSFFFQDTAALEDGEGDGDGEEEQQRRARWRFLSSFGRLRSNVTSQVALVGTDVCPIESLDYELIENDVFKQDWRAQGRNHILRYFALKWALCFLVGALTAVAAFLANLGVENVAGVKFVITSTLMFERRFESAFIVFLVSNFLLTMFATALTVYVAPAAAGSGIPEVKAYLNGVDAPNIFCLKTLLVKVVGCIAAVSASLHVGKAGPLVHTGACIASILGQGGSRKYRMTSKWLRYFKNDRDRRDLVTCGAGAGIAGAFRAPVAGVLFALETVSSRWRSALLWRAFFTTAIVAVVLRVLIDVCKSGRCGLFGKGGLIMFDVTSGYINYHAVDLPPVITLAVLGGVLGSLYNLFLDKVLRLYNVINQRGQTYKLLLAATVTICTSCCLFGLPWLAACKPCPIDSEEACPSIGRSGNFKKFQCQMGNYNDLASLLFNTNDDTIRNLYSSGTDHEFHLSSILLFFLASYFLGIFSYGLALPSGLFVPLILTGAAYGRLVGMLIGSESTLDHGLFAVLGSAALLGGSMRMTVSVCVVMLELTNNLLMLPLVMLVLIISKTVADAFNANVYDLLVKLKGFPFLEGHAEPYMRQLSVSDVVTGPLQTFGGIEKVGRIVHVLKTTGHNGFPVVDEPPISDGPELYGLILRAHLLVLLRKKEFASSCTTSALDASKHFSPDEFAKRGSGKHDRIEDIELTADEMEMFLDLHPFTNTSPYTVVETMSLAKALILFREVGLRHLLVLPKSSKRSPVVGILTRHDFMPEHVLGIHPYLFKSRWKKVRFGKSAFTNFFSH
ncbi:putative chloride channel-like protein CLC-g isoform X1 [Lolium rigidum]|uniref:putative chloride channel-like protein CLC-g isoform X1 n=1 Tax=Lolium rigidum TaxID=89674 RepID=UPI001F5C7F70|nr:putative chloride channel-like protein CLC-g isoform X1 [Lolium rigidum]